MTGVELQAATQLVLWSAGVELNCQGLPAVSATTKSDVIAWARQKLQPSKIGRFDEAARVLVWFIVRDLLVDDWTMVDRWAKYANTALIMWKD